MGLYKLNRCNIMYNMNWKILISYAPLIRLAGNWGVSFFGSLSAFNFITDFPTSDIITGSLLTSCVTTGLALCYEARKFQLGSKP